MWLTTVISLLLLLGAHAKVRHPPIGPYKGAGRLKGIQRPPAAKLLEQCELRYRDTRLDHLTWANTTTFSQRYFVCDRHWRKGGSVFFYLGNEADVTLYLNNTGLMWELAPKYNALLVFPEHRYYGQSKPFGKHIKEHMQWLTTEQAMADYAALIWDLTRHELKDPQVPVIGFGGSYGGMLATWFRMKYPHLMEGAIAASAPIWTYLGEEPPVDPGAFAKIVTRDAWPEGGSAHDCADNVRKSWKILSKWGKSKEGRASIQEAMRLCDDSSLDSQDDVAALMDWASSAWDYMAMGDYPYPSSYMLNGNGELPAYPVRVACEHLASSDLEGRELLSNLAQAVGVFYNQSGDAECLSFKEGPNPETDEASDFWGYQYCTEQFMPFSKDGVHDMFWPQPWDEDAAVEACREQWGVEPRPFHATIEWGGRRIEAASNIVFSNGLLDPWSGGGVLHNISDTLVAVLIPEGAHHLDLMFSHELDPPSVKHARALEEHFIAKWIEEARSRQPPTGAAMSTAAALGRRGAGLKGPTAVSLVA